MSHVTVDPNGTVTRKTPETLSHLTHHTHDSVSYS